MLTYSIQQTFDDVAIFTQWRHEGLAKTQDPWRLSQSLNEASPRELPGENFSTKV